MIYWAPLLHFYQPPTQVHWVLDKICDESYRPLIKIFKDNAQARVTVNMNAVLTELLRDHGKRDIIEDLAGLAARGQVEFTDSGKYHPILPLLPEEEVERQIVLNSATNRELFGSSYVAKGFFPPEMAYSKGIVEAIIHTGHNWVVLSGVACPVEWPMNVVHEIAPDGQRNLAVFFRDDLVSNRVSFLGTDARGFLDQLISLRGKRKDIYVVTAMDAETFGHHIKNWEKLFLEEVYEALQVLERAGKDIRRLKDLAREQASVLGASEIEVVTVSQLLDIFPRGSLVEPRRSSWSTSGSDIEAGNFFPLWNDPANDIHRLLWEHMHITIDMVHAAVRLADSEPARSHARLARGLMDRALHSDQFWWAAKKPMWDINLVNRGLMQQSETLLNAYKALVSSGISEQQKLDYQYHEVAARDIRGKVRDLLFRG